MTFPATKKQTFLILHSRSAKFLTRFLGSIQEGHVYPVSKVNKQKNKSVFIVFLPVQQQVCYAYLVDQFVDRASPFEKNLVEAAKRAGVGHISGVGDGHDEMMTSPLVVARMTGRKLTLSLVA